MTRALTSIVRDQRKTVAAAAVLAAAAFWILGPLDEWLLATCIAIGVGLGLVNHLATELWLRRVISSGKGFTRQQLAASTFVRLLVLTIVAVTIAVLLWPSGVGLLFGLALFRLLALVMTSLPLLKELKKA